MNILFLSAHVPSPVGRQAGLKTSYQICEWLAAQHSLHLLCFATEDERRNYRPQDNEIFHCWETINVTMWSRLSGVVRESHNPISVAARSTSLFRTKLRSLLQSHQFDVAILDHTSMWQYARELSAVPVLVGSAHDVVSQLWQRKAQLEENFLLRSFFRMEHTRVQKWEGSALGELDVIAPHSNKDGELLRQMNPSACVCPIRPWFTFSRRVYSNPREPGSIVFLGALDRSENQDAVEYGIRKILPLIRNKCPGFRFYIVGNHSDRMKRFAQGFDDIEIAGFVDDLPGFLSRMQIALLPLRFGAGIKVKMLECMASGLAVVTTATGAEGVGGENGVHYLVGESAEDLANSTIRLLKDPGSTQSMGDRGRALVMEEFNFGKAMERLWSLVENRLVESTPVVHV